MTRILSLVVVGLFSTSAFAVKDHRPLRSYFAKLNQHADKVKRSAAQLGKGWVITENLIIGPEDEGFLSAKRLSDLEAQWTIPIEFDVSAPVAVFGQFIVASFRDGSVWRIDAATGQVNWKTNLGSYVNRSMSLSGATILAVNIRQELYALDFQTGKMKWFYEAGAPEEIVVFGGAAPIVDGGVVYFGTSYGEIHAVNRESGQGLWRKDPQFSTARFNDVIGEMVISNGVLFLTRYDGLLAGMKLGLGEPEVEWAEKLPSATTSSFRNGRLYVGSLNGEISAYELVNGRLVWKNKTGVSVSSLNILQESLVSVGSNGRVTIIDLKSGKDLWHEDLYGEFSAKPVIHDGSLFVFSGLGAIYGYKL